MSVRTDKCTDNFKNLIGSNLIGSKIPKTWSDRTWSDRQFHKPDRLELDLIDNFKNLIGSNLIGSTILKTWSDRTWSDRQFQKPDRIDNFKNLIGSTISKTRSDRTWSDRRFQKHDRIGSKKSRSDPIKSIRSGYADPCFEVWNCEKSSVIWRSRIVQSPDQKKLSIKNLYTTVTWSVKIWAQFDIPSGRR